MQHAWFEYLLSSSDGVSRPIFTSPGLDGCRSRSQACCLKTLNVARIWLTNISVIQRVFLSVVFAGMKQPKQLEKCHKFEKIQRRGGGDIFWKNSAHKFWSIECRSWNFLWSLGLESLHHYFLVFLPVAVSGVWRKISVENSFTVAPGGSGTWISVPVLRPCNNQTCNVYQKTVMSWLAILLIRPWLSQHPCSTACVFKPKTCKYLQCC